MRIIKNGSDVLDQADCLTINCCFGAVGAFPDEVEDEL